MAKNDAMSSAATVALPLLTELPPGALFAHRYQVERLLGQGGMGTVYSVFDRELEERVALKVLRPEIAGDAPALERFRREVKLARRVTHPNVARTYDLGKDGGVRFLTMELIAGEPLSGSFGVGRAAALPEALRIVDEIARGLAAAHSVGVVHRDLKPDNVMITGESRDTPGGSLGLCRSSGRVVITDFGIARLAHGREPAANVTVGVVLGTPAYMAPEQLEGRELDGRADVYALGVLLFELLTGTLPFTGDSVYAIAAARLTMEPPDARSVDPTIPPAVAELLLSAMSRSRDVRPDVQQILARVEQLRGGSAGSNARPVELRSFSSTGLQLAAHGPRGIVVLPFDGADPSGEALARDLARAIGDAASGVRSLRLLPTPAQVAGERAEPAAAGRAAGADLVVEGSVRLAGRAARVRARLTEPASGNVAWAGRFEGTLDDPFSLEDSVVEGVMNALRARSLDSAAQRGPADPEARRLYLEARAVYSRFGAPFMREARTILESANETFPNDPWIMSALGAVLTRLWLYDGAKDSALILRAEEISLRALSLDSSIGETYATIGVLRVNSGELRAALRAFQEATARTPLLAEPHEYIGRFLCETGRTDEGMRRLEVAIKLEPNSFPAWWERARTAALLGDRAQAEVALARAIEIAGGREAAAFQRCRLYLWWKDMNLARALLEALEAASSRPPGFSLAMPMIRAALAQQPLMPVIRAFQEATSNTDASPRQRAFTSQMAAEMLCFDGAYDAALGAVEHAAALPLVDLLWLDRCPLLAPLRDDPRFARARAATAARAAELWA